MNESAPAPARPAVPWWERVAAGVLAVGWMACVITDAGSFGWGFWVRVEFAELQIGWQRLLVALIDPALWLSEPTLRFLRAGLYLGGLLGVPILVLWSLWRAVWPRWDRSGRMLWWAALCHGLLVVLYQCIHSRHALSVRNLRLHEGWLAWIDDDVLRLSADFLLRHALEILLAALILGLGWWTRRHGKAAAAE